MRLNQLAKNKFEASHKQTQPKRKSYNVCKPSFPFGKIKVTKIAKEAQLS